MTSPAARLALLALAALATGCATAQRATLEQLRYRATFDLGCPGGQLWLYHIDSRTKAVRGCGQRLVYLEHCDTVAGACSWKIDTPALLLAQGQPPMGQPVPGTAGWLPVPGSGATTGQGSATAPGADQPRGRAIPTELYGSQRARTAAQPPDSRQAPTELFGDAAAATDGPDAKKPAPSAPPPPYLPSPRKAAPPKPPSPQPPSTVTPPPPATPYDLGF